MKEMSIQSFSHSESPIDDSISTSEKHRINAGVPQSSCSCILPNFQHNLVQGEWRISLFVDMNTPQINTFVFNASIPITGCVCCEIQLFPQVLEDFLKVPINGDLQILWNCKFDLPNWLSSPRSSFLTQAEFEDSSLRPSFLVLEI